jgi:hypothetical protein
MQGVPFGSEFNIFNIGGQPPPASPAAPTPASPATPANAGDQPAGTGSSSTSSDESRRSAIIVKQPGDATSGTTPAGEKPAGTNGTMKTLATALVAGIMAGAAVGLPIAWMSGDDKSTDTVQSPPPPAVATDTVTYDAGFELELPIEVESRSSQTSTSQERSNEQRGTIESTQESQ